MAGRTLHDVVAWYVEYAMDAKRTENPRFAAVFLDGPFLDGVYCSALEKDALPRACLGEPLFSHGPGLCRLALVEKVSILVFLDSSPVGPYSGQRVYEHR